MWYWVTMYGIKIDFFDTYESAVQFAQSLYASGYADKENIAVC